MPWESEAWRDLMWQWLTVTAMLAFFGALVVLVAYRVWQTRLYRLLQETASEAERLHVLVEELETARKAVRPDVDRLESDVDELGARTSEMQRRIKAIETATGIQLSAEEVEGLRHESTALELERDRVVQEHARITTLMHKVDVEGRRVDASIERVRKLQRRLKRYAPLVEFLGNTSLPKSGR